MIKQSLSCFSTGSLFILLPVSCKDFSRLLLKPPDINKHCGEGNAIYSCFVSISRLKSKPHSRQDPQCLFQSNLQVFVLPAQPQWLDPQGKGRPETFYKPLHGKGWALQVTAAVSVEGGGSLYAGGHLCSCSSELMRQTHLWDIQRAHGHTHDPFSASVRPFLHSHNWLTSSSLFRTLQ